MPSKSKAQQGLMGAVYAAKKGEKPASPKVAKIAKGMTTKAAKDFASTSTKSLPNKVKKTKTEESLLKDFEDTIQEVTITSGPNKGKQWSPQNPGPTNPDFKDDGSMGPSDGATAPPPGYKPPKPSTTPKVKPMKKAEVDTDIEEPSMAESKTKPRMTKKAGAGKVLKDLRAKHMKESILVLGRMIAEAKKGKCNHTMEGKSCPVHGMKECGGMYESKAKCTCTESKASHKTCEVHGKMDEALKGGQKKIAKAAPPTDKITGDDFKALKKMKKTDEAVDQNNDGKNDFEDVKIARMKAALKSKKKIKESFSKEELANRLFENADNHESDDESSMAKAELVAIVKNATDIFKAIKDNENLDAWVSSYISVANDHLNSIAEQMNGEEVEQAMSPEDEYMENLRHHLNSLKG